MNSKNERIGSEFLRLVDIMRTLRSPEGCSWDRKQTTASMAEHITEEAREVVEAIQGGDDLHIKEELGDLLMTIVFSAQIAAEAGTYDMSDVCAGICDKLINRHPHVFGDAARGADPEKVIQMWGEIKKQEKVDRKRLSNRMREALDFPSSLAGAEKIQAEAAKVGFDFPDAHAALAKIKEETAEIETAIVAKNREEIEDEIGDVLFAVLNVSRLSGVNAEQCLRQSTRKFVERFSRVETLVEEDGGFAGKGLEELDRYWDRVKLEK
ncbi:MAG TPA: nucleoside triphosphate pyrophosphohydrolase [Candidatus Rifleibacterium sp.]|nr:nucleoside triphosphate pyrophosphohydrolase [Candidatus Rifleibacterium sp.]